jgi:hypothetical protein
MPDREEAEQVESEADVEESRAAVEPRHCRRRGAAATDNTDSVAAPSVPGIAPWGAAIVMMTVMMTETMTETAAPWERTGKQTGG